MNKPRGTNQSSSLNQGLLPTKHSPPESPPLPPVSPEGKAKVDMLLVQVDALPVSEDSCLIEHQLNALHDACVLACSDAETLKYAVERLHRVCLKKQSMCSKVAMLSNAVSSFEIEGLRFRSVLLNCLQEDYEAREKMQSDYPERFLNAATLLCEVFTRIRSNNTPITVLSKPVLEYLEALLSGDEQEIELFAHLVALTGNDLKNVAQVNFQKLLLRVRDTLKSRNLSSQCRLWLLLIMDLSNRYFDSSPADIDDFYMEHLGPSSTKLVDLVKTSLKHQQIPVDQDIKVSEKVPEKVPQNEIKEPIMKTEKISPKSDTATMPQGNDGDKRENFRTAIQLSSSSSKGTRGKYWLHDDRFENDGYSEAAPSTQKPTSSASNWRQQSSSKPVRETVGHKTSRDPNSGKTFNGEKNNWRNTSSNQQVSPPQLDWQENWDE